MELARLMNVTGISDTSESESEPETESGTARAKAPRDKAKRPDRFAPLQTGIQGQMTMLGMMIYSFSEKDGTVILEHAESLSINLVNLARQKPAVYRALKAYLETSIYMEIGAEVLTIVLALLANHGMNPVAWLIERVKGKGPAADDGNSDLSAVA